MPAGSADPLPTTRVTFPFRSAPAAPMFVVHAFGAGSSAVPYAQSGPGSVVSPTLVTSLSPNCGFDVFTTPKPHRYWSSREQSPPRRGTRNVGMVKPGSPQQLFRMHPGFGAAGGAPQSGMPGHAAPSFPHATQSGCSQRVVSSVTVA